MSFAETHHGMARPEQDVSKKSISLILVRGIFIRQEGVHLDILNTFAHADEHQNKTRISHGIGNK